MGPFEVSVDLLRTHDLDPGHAPGRGQLVDVGDEKADRPVSGRSVPVGGDEADGHRPVVVGDGMGGVPVGDLEAQALVVVGRPRHIRHEEGRLDPDGLPPAASGPGATLPLQIEPVETPEANGDLRVGEERDGIPVADG